jgi:hypothetical protein
LLLEAREEPYLALVGTGTITSKVHLVMLYNDSIDEEGAAAWFRRALELSL